MTKSIKSGKHLYARGWFGLIPLVGGIVGIGLIILGVFKYKDRKLILIGTLALLVTVGIYSFLIYYLEYSPEGRKGFKELSQMQLNSLVKNIEFYKLEHNAYPDSLEQLFVNDSSFVEINDPLLSIRKRNTKYNYFRSGTKYHLFSSGIDQIPNTSDDLYPTIIDSSNKFGFIRKK